MHARHEIEPMLIVFYAHFQCLWQTIEENQEALQTEKCYINVRDFEKIIAFLLDIRKRKGCVNEIRFIWVGSIVFDCRPREHLKKTECMLFIDLIQGDFFLRIVNADLVNIFT